MEDSIRNFMRVSTRFVKDLTKFDKYLTKGVFYSLTVNKNIY